MTNRNLISPKALSDAIKTGTKNLSILDASWYLPTQNRDAKREFLEARIPGAQYFDIDDISDQTNSLPHMMPNEKQFAGQVGALGVNEKDQIVVYDGAGIFSAARAWWMFKVMGAQNVRILEGGFAAWKSGKFEIESGPPEPSKIAGFTANFDPIRVASLGDIQKNLDTKEAIVLDARSAERFAGTAPEPRAGLRGGHIPGSKSLPFQLLTQSGSLKPKSQLQEIFDKVGVTENTPVVTSCGSGVTAAVLSLALDTVGHKNHSLYDGSWSEWGLNKDVPVATGSGG